MNIEERVRIHLVLDAAGAWVHTHGLDELGLPELEIRDVPSFLGPAAGRLLTDVAGYMVEQHHGETPVELGHTMRVGSAPAFLLVELPPVKGAECHYRHARWALVDDPGQPRDCCGGRPARAQPLGSQRRGRAKRRRPPGRSRVRGRR